MKKSTIKDIFVRIKTTVDMYKMKFLVVLNRDKTIKNTRYKIVELEILASTTSKKLLAVYVELFSIKAKKIMLVRSRFTLKKSEKFVCLKKFIWNYIQI